MGADIHAVVQVRKGGAWRAVDRKLACHRNYRVFAALAGVRNGSSAGCDMGDMIEPIAEPRGFPEDVVRECPTCDHGEDESVEGRWLGDHSHSWLTLSELNAYVDLYAKRTTKRRGYVFETEFAAMLKRGETAPREYCGDVGGGAVKVEAADYAARVAARAAASSNERIYVRCEWDEPYAPPELMRDYITPMSAIGRELGVTQGDVRLVFGFDS